MYNIYLCGYAETVEVTKILVAQNIKAERAEATVESYTADLTHETFATDVRNWVKGFNYGKEILWVFKKELIK